MKRFIFSTVLLLAAGIFATSCFNMEETVYNRIDAGEYYKSEENIRGALGSTYAAGIRSLEYFYHLQEFSADQVAWRTWNGGGWGYDDGAKTVISTHTWNSASVIVTNAWKNTWTTINQCNTLLADLDVLDPEALGMTTEKMDAYKAEARMLRAWAYYSLFEVWGGVLPVYTTVGTVNDELPFSASEDFEDGCKVVYDFIMTELDETLNLLPVNEVNRVNKAVNRVLKARLLLNSEIFIGEDHYDECATLCQDIIDGDFGTYSIVGDHRDIFSINNTSCPEVIWAFAYEVGQTEEAGILNQRNWPYFPYNIDQYVGGVWSGGGGGWNCVCLVPSYDNSGTIQPQGGTTGAVSFLDAPYNDKLGAVYERYNDRDVRKKVFKAGADGTYEGMFLIGPMKADFGTGAFLKADADRDKQDLYYVDQVGTFLNKGRDLETVMSPRWGETNSGVRLMKYPMYPQAAGINFLNIDEVEFRLTEVVYMLAECKLRAGDAPGAKTLVNSVRQRYFRGADWATAQDDAGVAGDFNEDWMLDQWGQEFLNEGRRRRTDLRRFDKFTQGQWWFFGRANDMPGGAIYPAKRDRKYEWFPLPDVALSSNPNLVQNPNY